MVVAFIFSFGLREDADAVDSIVILGSDYTKHIWSALTRKYEKTRNITNGTMTAAKREISPFFIHCGAITSWSPHPLTHLNMAKMEFGELGRGLQITEPVATDPDRIQG